MILLGPLVGLCCVSINEIWDLLDQETKNMCGGNYFFSVQRSGLVGLHILPEDEWCPDALGGNGRLWPRIPSVPQSPSWGSGRWREGAWGGTAGPGPFALPLHIVAAWRCPALTPSILQRDSWSSAGGKQDTEFEVSSRDANESWGELGVKKGSQKSWW